MRAPGDEQAARPTIMDVAQDAGVSPATVSRVLGGSASVSEGLVARVHESVRRLGYTPHSSAQSLASGRTRLIGVLVPNLANHYFYALIKRMLHDAERDGYRLIVADSDEKLAAERALGESLLRQTDGLILCSPRSPSNVLKEFTGGPKPVLVLNRLLDDPAVSNVVVESFTSMRQLGLHVTELGHKRTVYLQGPLRSWHSKERWRAVRSLTGLSVTPIRAGATMEAGLRAVPRILRVKPTAVLAYNDLTAIGVIVGLAEHGVRVPEDISVTGYDDIPNARYITPALTTVHSPQEDVGSVAWKAMSGLLDGDRPGARTVLAADLVIRQSTAAPRRSK